MTKRRSKGAYMISAVAEMYGIHPQTLRLYEREGLLKPSRTEGNTRLYTDEDLQRLEFILSLARDLGVNIAGMARSEEHTSELQSPCNLVCRLLLEKKKNHACTSQSCVMSRWNTSHTFNLLAS